MLGRLTAEAPPSAGGEGFARRCAAILDARLDRTSSAPLALAFSGGGDSLALLHLAAGWTRAHGRPLVALTVDHGLDPASGDWTRAAGEMARDVGAGWRTLRWEGDKPAAGLPAAARQARHRLLARAAHEAGARIVLVAHTAADVAEGEVMRAADAPGLGRLREWGPSPVWPEGRGLALLRPLLHAGREDLRAWLGDRGLSWIEDPANADPSHPRIRARRALACAERAPPFPVPVGPPLFHADPGGVVHASRAALTHTPSEAVLPQLAAALACAGGTAGPVRGRVCADLLARLRSGAPLHLNAGGAAVRARGDAVTLARENPRTGRPANAADPAWVRARLDLALGATTTEAGLSLSEGG